MNCTFGQADKIACEISSKITFPESESKTISDIVKKNYDLMKILGKVRGKEGNS